MKFKPRDPSQPLSYYYSPLAPFGILFGGLIVLSLIVYTGIIDDGNLRNQAPGFLLETIIAGFVVGLFLSFKRVTATFDKVTKSVHFTTTWFTIQTAGYTLPYDEIDYVFIQVTNSGRATKPRRKFVSYTAASHRKNRGIRPKRWYRVELVTKSSEAHLINVWRQGLDAEAAANLIGLELNVKREYQHL